MSADSESGTAARRAKQAAQKAKAPKAPLGANSSASASVSASGAGGVAESPAELSRPTRRALDPDRLAALEEQRAFLLGSLDDLEREHDAGDIDDVDYVGLKDDYTARAARVIRAIDEREQLIDAVRDPRSRRRSVVIAVVVFIVALGAGLAVAQASGRREAGQTTSGETRSSTRERLFKAQQLLGDNKILDAIKVYDEILADEPANVQALTYKGWLLRLTSLQTSSAADKDTLVAKAKALLDQAILIDPAYPDARVFRAILLAGLDRPQEALADLQILNPGDIPVFMAEMVDQLRTRLVGELAPGGTTPGTTTAPSTR